MSLSIYEIDDVTWKLAGDAISAWVGNRWVGWIWTDIHKQETTLTVILASSFEPVDYPVTNVNEGVALFGTMYNLGMLNTNGTLLGIL